MRPTRFRVIDTNTTVLLAGASNDDNPEVVSLKAQLAASQAETKALMDTTTPATTAGEHTILSSVPLNFLHSYRANLENPKNILGEFSPSSFVKI